LTRYLTEGRSVVNAVRTVRLVIVYKLIAELRANPRNPRKHSKKQIQQIAKSIRTFGFLVPILVDAEGNIICGHGRIEAAQLEGMTEVPTICATNLTEPQIRAFMMADNRLMENSEWDERLLAEQFKELSELNLDFDLESTGFEMAEIDLLIEGLSPAIQGEDPADKIPDTCGSVPVTQSGNLWLLDAHRVLCGDARDPQSFAQLMDKQRAAMIFIDPPYNVPIDGHASGKGAIKHPHFLMAAGEMSKAEYTAFLIKNFELLSEFSADGTLAFVCMDWRHIGELLAAGEQAFTELKNVCVWSKDRAGMGSLYRSQHELVFVFKIGTAPHINNIQLGQFGRYRTNVWEYPSAVSFGHVNEEGNLLTLHPTVKPAAMVADAMLDCSRRGDIVLDSFLGSGTTVVAAEKVGRFCYGMEIDPKYVDVVVRRWQAFTGKAAVHGETGQSFAEIEEEVKRVRL
jgi:DNA modification methylase